MFLNHLVNANLNAIVINKLTFKGIVYRMIQHIGYNLQFHVQQSSNIKENNPTMRSAEEETQ